MNTVVTRIFFRKPYALHNTKKNDNKYNELNKLKPHACKFGLTGLTLMVSYYTIASTLNFILYFVNYYKFTFIKFILSLNNHGSDIQNVLNSYSHFIHITWYNPLSNRLQPWGLNLRFSVNCRANKLYNETSVSWDGQSKCLDAMMQIGMNFRKAICSTLEIHQVHFAS